MIKIICMGKIKENFFKEAILEYKKRLTKYTSLEIIELEDSNDLEKEAKQILKNIKDKEYVITLEIEGEMLNSELLALKLEKEIDKYTNITFVIGSSYGLAPSIKKRANYSLSFSKLTFPHQLFRVILLEQIYRCFKIKNNESYHK